MPRTNNLYSHESEEYQRYIKSDLWESKRQQSLNHWGHVCMACGQPAGPLDIHHRTYDRFGGNELMDDIIPLCRACHDGVHHVNNTMKQKHGKGNLIFFTDEYVRYRRSFNLATPQSAAKGNASDIAAENIIASHTKKGRPSKLGLFFSPKGFTALVLTAISVFSAVFLFAGTYLFGMGGNPLNILALFVGLFALPPYLTIVFLRKLLIEVGLSTKTARKALEGENK